MHEQLRASPCSSCAGLLMRWKLSERSINGRRRNSLLQHGPCHFQSRTRKSDSGCKQRGRVDCDPALVDLQGTKKNAQAGSMLTSYSNSMDSRVLLGTARAGIGRHTLTACQLCFAYAVRKGTLSAGPSSLGSCIDSACSPPHLHCASLAHFLTKSGVQFPGQRFQRTSRIACSTV